MAPPRVSTTSYPMFNRANSSPMMDDTLIAAKSASQNLDLTSQRSTPRSKTHLGDQYGEDAGTNLQQSLTNINQATGNLTDDTEALKHDSSSKVSLSIAATTTWMICRLSSIVPARFQVFA